MIGTRSSATTAIWSGRLWRADQMTAKDGIARHSA
jgi:hypothetical protein